MLVVVSLTFYQISVPYFICTVYSHNPTFSLEGSDNMTVLGSEKLFWLLLNLGRLRLRGCQSPSDYPLRRKDRCLLFLNPPGINIRVRDVYMFKSARGPGFSSRHLSGMWNALRSSF